MAITITNKHGLYLMQEGFNSFCFTKEKNLAVRFDSKDSAEKVKKRLHKFTGLKINVQLYEKNHTKTIGINKF